MGRLWTNVAKWEYRKPDRLLTEQFIGHLNADDMTDKTIREITTLENIEEATSEYVLCWMHRVEAQRAQRSVLYTIREAKDFDAI